MCTDTHTFYTIVTDRATGMRRVFLGFNHHQRAVEYALCRA